MDLNDGQKSIETQSKDQREHSFKAPPTLLEVSREERRAECRYWCLYRMNRGTVCLMGVVGIGEEWSEQMVEMYNRNGLAVYQPCNGILSIKSFLNTKCYP